jgi:hypothetical protein
MGGEKIMAKLRKSLLCDAVEYRPDDRKSTISQHLPSGMPRGPDEPEPVRADWKAHQARRDVAIFAPRCVGQDFVTFQNTTDGPSSNPVKLSRQAEVCLKRPRGMNGSVRSPSSS